jgi:hypothetical protein
MKLVIIDGQGGKIGSLVIKKIKEYEKLQEIYAIGTNSIATSAMLKAGADFGATGENPVIYNVKDADVVIGPIGIISANAILGEVTPNMAAAIGSCVAKKILIPIKNCHITIAGMQELTLSGYIDCAVNEFKILKETLC